MNKLKQQACCLLACAVVLLAPLAAHGAGIVVVENGSAGQGAFEVDPVPETGSVLMLAAALVVAGCKRRRGHGPGEFDG
jgi:hypothetical protein